MTVDLSNIPPKYKEQLKKLPDRVTIDWETDEICLRVYPVGAPNPINSYRVDCDRCATPEAFLDWVYQVEEKIWGTPEILGGLIIAFDIWCQKTGRGEARKHFNAYHRM